MSQERDAAPVNPLLREIEDSVNNGETLAQWWEGAHERKHTVWLTGSTAEEEWDNLEIRERVVPGISVLNIGVGFGHGTRGLHAQGCTTHALDISREALNRVNDIATTWLASDAHNLPKNYFDLALSHLVAQHMPNSALAEQIRNVIPTLKPDGLFAVQFAIPVGRKAGDPENLEDARGGSLQREPEVVEDMVRAAGGRVVRSFRKAVFENLGAGWHIVHAGR